MTDSPDNSIQPLSAVAASSPVGVATPSTVPAVSPTARSGTSPRPDSTKQTDNSTANAPPTEAALRSAIDKLNAHAVTEGQSLRLTVDGRTRQMIVVVHDAETGAVVRQIPSEDVLRLARALDSGQGLVDLSA